MAVKYIKIGNEFYMEQDVLKANALHARGYSNAKIAEVLGITEREVVDILNRKAK